jgi:hypothetical protein
MGSSPVVFLIATLVVGILLFITILLTKKHSPKLDQEQYQIDFLNIQNGLKKEEPSSYAMTIIKGDKLLDKALCEIGAPGRTMGDRLKKVGKDKFTQLNSVWHAHKLRNEIAHESDFEPSYAQAQHALETYKQALQDLGAI